MKNRLHFLPAAVAGLTMAASTAFASPPTVVTTPIGTLGDPCTMEVVAFDGNAVSKYSATVQNGIAHVVGDISAHSGGVGQNSGAKYQLDYLQHSE